MVEIDQFGQRITRARYSGDFVYDSNNDDTALDEEDVPVVGPWEDYTGSDVNVNSKSLQQFGAAENELFADDAGLMGGKVPNLTERGNNLGTTRRRRIKRYIQ